MEKHEYIDFETIRSYLHIEDTNLFKTYLNEIYRDLADRAESNRKLGISKITFWNYMKATPVFITEKLFNALDKDMDSNLNSQEFCDGLFKLYLGSFEETAEFIFNVFDFDKDGYIEIGDVKVLFSYLPLKKNNENNNEYKYQIESLNEIDEILITTFGENNTKLDLRDYLTAIEQKKSDIYLQMLCFFYQAKPFTEENILSYRKFKKKSLTTSSSPLKINTEIPVQSKYSPNSSEKKRLLSPSRKSRFLPVDDFLQLTPLDNDSEDNNVGFSSNNMKKVNVNLNKMNDDSIDENIKIQLPSFPNKKKGLINDFKTENLVGEMIRMPNQRVLDNNKEIPKNIYDSPSTFLKRERVGGPKKMSLKASEFNLEDNLINMDLNKDNHDDKNNEGKAYLDSISSIRKRSSMKKSSIKEINDVYYESYVYKITESKKLKKYYLVLLGKDIYYYKTNKKEELEGMHNLSGCFVKEAQPKVFDGLQLFCFSIIFSSKTRNYYLNDKNELNTWVNYLKEAIGCCNFFDQYNMISDLGEGKFGLVKLGVHKKTSEKVAIKIIKKAAMNNTDMELVRSEIDIMKLCRHPNVVRLLDHYENSDYIFIIMEYLAGGDFGSYLTDRKFNFSEKEAADLIKQIAEGVRYLHQFGIAHRDLKPENIMLSDKSEGLVLKIMDFGLSKILGPVETAVDGYGTLSFVAPEVLIRQPYNKQIDIWSLGVTLYHILTGLLPFDDTSDNEEIIAKMIVFSELSFPVKYWKKRSGEVMDLLKRTLHKDPEKRIKIEEFLKHEWFSRNLN